MQALIVRAGVTTASGAILALEGDGSTALRMLQGLEDEMRRDYHDLHNRVRALARIEPSASKWRQVLPSSLRSVPFIASGDDEAARALVVRLDREMETKIGRELPSRDSETSLALPSAALARALSLRST